MVTSPVTRQPRAGHTAAVITRWGPPRPAPAKPLSAATRPAAQGQADGLIRLSGRIPAGRGHPINYHVAGAARRAPRTQVRLAAPAPPTRPSRPVTPDRKARALNR